MTTSAEPRIEHVVVLMLENRSFDHMLGFLQHPDPSYEGLRAGEHFNVSGAGVKVPATSDGRPDQADPDHSSTGVALQVGPYGGVPTNGGFVRSLETFHGGDGAAVMRCLDPATHCRVLAQLALEFAVCDHWHASVPGETWPNRNFAHAATSDAAADIQLGFYYDPTIFELLQKAGASWRIYHDGIPQAWCFRNLWQQQALPGQPATIANWFVYAEFSDHVRKGQLTNYTFIEPAHMANPFGTPALTDSQHPHNNVGRPDDFYRGEQLIKDVYDALAANPELFAKTLLVITYDEHGGWYDHVSPPSATPPNNPPDAGIIRILLTLLRTLIDRLNGRPQPTRFGFDRLGVRVPAVLISPWIKPGTVIHDTLEHASIPATVRQLFAPAAKSLTARDAAAGTFHHVVRDFALAAPRRAAADLAATGGPALPDLPAPAGAGTTRVLSTATEVVAGPSDLERQLADLSDKVQQELAPGSVVPRPGGGRGTRAMAAATSTPDVFAAAARAARGSGGVV